MQRRAFLAAMASLTARAAELPSIGAIRTHKHTLNKRDYLFVEVEAGRLTGLGEASLPFRVEIVEQAVLWLEPHLRGRPVSGIEDHWNRIYRDLSRWRDGAVLMTALSAIDIALWDIEGKRLGEPVWRLAGGGGTAARPLRVYYSHWDHGLQSRTEQGWAEWTGQSLERGWNAVKWVVPRASSEAERIERTVADLAAVREAASASRLQVGLEMFETFTVRSAIDFARAVEPYGVWFLEEPVERENPRMLGEVARATPIHLAGGEGLLDRFQFKTLLDAGGARIVQPDVIHCGGITELRKIAALSEVYGAEVAPHMWYGPVAHAASAQAMVGCRNFLAQEWDGASEALWAEVTKGTLPKQAKGHVQVPPGPGLGIEMDFELLRRKYPYAGRRETPKITPKPGQG